MISNVIRNLVKYHCNRGKSYTDIADLLNISRNSVISIIHYKLKVNKKKSGPKNKISDKTRLKIKRFVESSNSEGKIVNCNIVKNELCFEVPRRTINNFFLRSEFKFLKVRQKIGLTKVHKIKRLEIVSQWVERNISWESVIFTDEKRFTLDGPDNL